jgi:hypothetical protein
MTLGHAAERERRSSKGDGRPERGVHAAVGIGFKCLRRWDALDVTARHGR